MTTKQKYLIGSILVVLILLFIFRKRIANFLGIGDGLSVGKTNIPSTGDGNCVSPFGRKNSAREGDCGQVTQIKTNKGIVAVKQYLKDNFSDINSEEYLSPEIINDYAECCTNNRGIKTYIPSWACTESKKQELCG